MFFIDKILDFEKNVKNNNIFYAKIEINMKMCTIMELIKLSISFVSSIF